MNTLPDRIRAAARGKTRVRITGRSRSATGFTAALNGRPLGECPLTAGNPGFIGVFMHKINDKYVLTISAVMLNLNRKQEVYDRPGGSRK